MLALRLHADAGNGPHGLHRYQFRPTSPDALLRIGPPSTPGTRRQASGAASPRWTLARSGSPPPPHREAVPACGGRPIRCRPSAWPNTSPAGLSGRYSIADRPLHHRADPLTHKLRGLGLRARQIGVRTASTSRVVTSPTANTPMRGNTWARRASSASPSPSWDCASLCAAVPTRGARLLQRSASPGVAACPPTGLRPTGPACGWRMPPHVPRRATQAGSRRGRVPGDGRGSRGVAPNTVRRSGARAGRGPAHRSTGQAFVAVRTKAALSALSGCRPCLRPGWGRSLRVVTRLYTPIYSPYIFLEYVTLYRILMDEATPSTYI